MTVAAAIARTTVVFSALSICCASAFAARPFFTDDARIVDNCQIETFYKEQRTYSGSEFWFLPACKVLGFEITAGGNRIEGDRNEVVQAKFLLKPLDAKVREGSVKPKESVSLTDFYEQAMRGYTYLASI